MNEVNITDLDEGEQIVYETYGGDRFTADFVDEDYRGRDGFIEVSFVGYPDVASMKTVKPKRVFRPQ